MLIFAASPHILHFDPIENDFEVFLDFVLRILPGYILNAEAIALLNNLLIANISVLLLTLNALTYNVEFLLHQSFFFFDFFDERFPAHGLIQLHYFIHYLLVLLG